MYEFWASFSKLEIREPFWSPNQDQGVLLPLRKVHQIHHVSLCYGVCLQQCVGFKTRILRDYKEVDSGTMGTALLACLLTLAELSLKGSNFHAAESPGFQTRASQPDAPREMVGIQCQARRKTKQHT